MSRWNDGPAKLRVCGCGARILGHGFVEAIGDTASVAGPRLCQPCAADHARERPDGIAAAGPGTDRGGVTA